MIGIREPMPRVLGDEYRSALFKRVTHIVQYENSAAFQNVEGFVHLEMSVDRNACADRHLLAAQGDIVGACGGASLDEDIPMVAKVKEMFTFGGAEHISLWCRGLSPTHALQQYLAKSKAPQAEKEGSAFLLECIHEIFLCGASNRGSGLDSCDKPLSRSYHCR